MSNSPLVNYTRLSPNRTVPRRHVIDTITIHCTGGKCTAVSLGAQFAPPSRGASSNYGIGYDGSIGMYCPESDKSWCSSNIPNDHRAVTIEVSSEAVHPYKVTDAAYKALLDLVTDICKRNGIKKLVWSNSKSDRINHRNGCNMTVHRDFANKACPGDYLYNLHPQIAAEVNRRLTGSAAASKPTPDTTVTSKMVRVTTGSLNIRSGPGTNYSVVGKITDRGVYTVVQESNGPGASRWGKLKSGAGWIALDYTKSV